MEARGQLKDYVKKKWWLCGWQWRFTKKGKQSGIKEQTVSCTLCLPRPASDTVQSMSLSFSWNFSNVLSVSPRIHILRTWSPQWEMGPSGHCLDHKVQVLINELKLPQEEFVVGGLLLSFFLLLYFSLLKYFPRGGALPISGKNQSQIKETIPFSYSLVN